MVILAQHSYQGFLIGIPCIEAVYRLDHLVHGYVLLTSMGLFVIILEGLLLVLPSFFIPRIMVYVTMNLDRGSMVDSRMLEAVYRTVISCSIRTVESSMRTLTRMDSVGMDNIKNHVFIANSEQAFARSPNG